MDETKQGLFLKQAPRVFTKEAETPSHLSPHQPVMPLDTPSPRVVSFDDCPMQNPKNWGTMKKSYIVLVTLFSLMNSGISTSLPSNAVPFILDTWNMKDDGQSSLPTALFLVGYIVGPLIFSPLSETVGRRLVLVPSFIAFSFFTLACALAPNWPSLLFFRFMGGTMGSAPQTVVGGVYADMFEIRNRGRVMTFYMAIASFGPILGPIISGFAADSYSWRWAFWIELMFAGTVAVGLLFLPETFAPVLLKRRASTLTKTTGIEHVAPPSNVKTTDLWTVFKRPLDMLLFEPIISSTSIYIALAYALVFFYFQAYPIIFPNVYGFNIQMTSLAFLPVGTGAAFTGFVALYWDIHYEKALNVTYKRPLSLPFSPELHRLPLSCIGSLSLVISLFWLAWTATPTIHWAVPTASGFLFGFGYQTIFISLLTYVTDAYKIYSASALASSVILRSILGAVLPIAAKPMYAQLGVGWATSTIGFLSLACVPIPFILLFFGGWIRERSTFCQMLVQSEKQRDWPGASSSARSFRAQEDSCHGRA